MPEKKRIFFVVVGLVLFVPGTFAQRPIERIPLFTTGIVPPSAVHHYVYENGRYIPRFYTYDPHPNYFAYSHRNPPHYTAKDLSYYMGRDRGRWRTYTHHLGPFVHD